MENQNNNRGVITLLIVFIVILAVLCVLFATGTISLKPSTTNNGQQASENNSQNDKVISNEEAVIISKNIMDKYFNEVFYYHQAPYCGTGTYDFNEGESLQYYTAENGNSYLPSKEYKTKSEIIEYFKSYLSDKLIEKIVNDRDYIEKDDKLYCLVPNKGSLSYVKEKSIYEVSNITENKIIGKGIIAYDATGAELTLKADFTLIRKNNNWILDNYKEDL